MGVVHLFTRLTIVSILFVSLLSGPLVDVVDLSPKETTTTIGEGSAHIEFKSAPTGGQLTKTVYASTGYLLSIPPATLDVSNVSGRPMIVYKLRITELWYVAGTTHVLDEKTSGRYRLKFQDSVVNRTSLPDESYQAELLVIKRAHERDTVIHRDNVTLQVDQ